MEKDKWLSTVSSVLGVPIDKLTELDELDDDAAVRGVKDLGKTLITKTRDEGHGKGLKKGTEAIRKALKSEFSLDLTDDEVDADKIVAAVREKVEEEAGEGLTEEAVKQTPAYKELSSELVKAKQVSGKTIEKQVKERLAEEQKKFDAKLAELKKESMDPALFREAEKWLTKMKAVLPEDETKRDKVIKDLVNKAKANGLDKDGEDWLITKPDGSAFLNASGHNATLEDVFAEYDYLYTFQQTQQRGSTGIDPKNPGGQAPPTFEHFKGTLPKTEAEMKQLQFDRVNGKITREAYKEAEAAFTAANAK